MRLPLYQVDAFTDRLFGGNPAAVMPLPHWLDNVTLAALAAENNLSETAFLVAEGAGWRLRWFTPAIEVDLCGHATLASAHVLFAHLGVRSERLQFSTASGPLSVARLADGRLELDFPARTLTAISAPAGLGEALGATPQAVFDSGCNYLAVFADEAAVGALRPDFRALAALERQGVIVTAAGEAVDFVSRYFAPAAGIDEDPVTGSAHCELTPYWAERLGRSALRARQVSARGGTLGVRLNGDRVGIVGRAVTYLCGQVELPG